MITRILLAVDDSPDSLAAARVAVELAGRLRAELRAVHVRTNLAPAVAVETPASSPPDGRRTSAAAILAHVATLAQTAEVDVQTEFLEGDVVPAVLDAAHAWHAQGVVVGKATRSTTGSSYVGTQTRHLLEFADLPVLVIPHAPVEPTRYRTAG